MKKLLFKVFTCLSAAFVFANGLVDSSESNFILATKEQGNEFLKTQDDFTSSLSQFDRSARLCTSETVTDEDFLNFIAQQAQDWTQEESEFMEQMFAIIKERFTPYKISLPENIYFVKTTGLEEGDSAYCRLNNVIVTSAAMLSDDMDSMLKLFVHELFHIYSRNNLDTREKLYKQIGFTKTQELTLPQDIQPYKITNPDSPSNSYYFDTKVKGKKVKVMPILLAVSEYDQSKGGAFFEYMTLVFFAVTTGKDGTFLKTEKGKYLFYSLDEISNYLDKVGKNTNYIIHAEEIMAENFELMINGSPNIPSPKIITNMKKVFKK